MIIKNLTRRSGTRQLLTYLLEKKEKHLDGKAIVIKHNIRSRSINGHVKTFEENESYRLHKRKNNIRLHHTIISFSAKDKQHISEKMVRDIARKYVQARGRNNMYIITLHSDREHLHLHFVMSAVEYATGISNRISRKEFHDLKMMMDHYQLEKYPELIHSLPKHGKSKSVKLKGNEYQLIKRNERLSEKQTLLKLLETTFTKSTSVDHFLSQLKATGYDPYYRAGKLTGVQSTHGMKFRLRRLGYDNEKLELLNPAPVKEMEVLHELWKLRGKHTLRERGGQDGVHPFLSREV